MIDPKDERDWAIAEFSLMTERERHFALWHVDQFKDFCLSRSELNVYHWSWRAANDNVATMHTSEVFDYLHLVRMNSWFRDILELWRACKYDAILTKLAFPI